jgi:hypothetical protein
LSPSQLAWLDHSAEDQRRVRDILRLFSDTESRDELGLGQIRDAYSDTLFPGTSVLLTRARYLLFIPWCFQIAQSAKTPQAILQRGQNYERGLIPLLAQEPGIEGLIGKRAGVAVQALPSVIYATALRRFGIQLGELDDLPPQAHGDAPSELTERSQGVWHRQLPLMPSGFPTEVSGGFDLTPAEAEFLCGRIASEVPGSYLTYLITKSTDLLEGDFAWTEPTASQAPVEIQKHLNLARTFSEVIHGANLLYNLLIAEEYESRGYSEQVGTVDLYRERLDAWSDRLAAQTRLASWEEIRWHAAAVNPRVAQNRRLGDFGAAWFGAVLFTRGRGITDDAALRTLVRSREYSIKHAQSRLVNDRLLRSWTGSSGAAQLTFRWIQVRRIVNDLLVGLEDGAHAGS